MTKKSEIKNVIKRINQNLSGTILVNLGVLCILLLLFCPRFGSDLDIMMQSVLYGVGENGIQGAHILFSNIIVGYLLDVLVMLLPGVPWYIIFHYLMVFAALCTITYITLQRNSNFIGKVIAVVFVIFTGYECYINPGYMKTAAILCAAAVYQLFYLLAQEKTKLFQWIWMAFCIIMSSMVSFSIFLITGILGLIGVISYYLVTKQQVNVNKKFWVFWGGALLLTIGSWFFDLQIYKGNNQWAQCAEYRSTAERILGYGSMEYSEELGEKYDVTEAEYQLLQKGIFVNTDEEKLDLVRDISNENKEFNWHTISRYFKVVPIRFFKMGMFYCWLMLLFMLGMSRERGKKLTVAIAILALLITYLVLYICNAWENQWISFIVFLPLSMMMLMSYRDMQLEEGENICVYIAVMGLVLYSTFSSQLVTSVREDDIYEAFKELEPSKVYVVDIDAYFRQFSAFEVYPQDIVSASNVYLVNGFYPIILGFGDSTSIGKAILGVGYEWIDNARGADFNALVEWEN